MTSDHRYTELFKDLPHLKFYNPKNTVLSFKSPTYIYLWSLPYQAFCETLSIEKEAKVPRNSTSWRRGGKRNSSVCIYVSGGLTSPKLEEYWEKEPVSLNVMHNFFIYDYLLYFGEVLTSKLGNTEKKKTSTSKFNVYFFYQGEY